MSKLRIVVTIASALLLLNTSAVLADKDKAKTNDALPPGLQKKVARGGELPPGWQTKIVVGKPVEVEIYEHHEIVVPIDENGLITVSIGGKLIRLIQATREVVEIIHN